jgi:hypothetical protein
MLFEREKWEESGATLSIIKNEENLLIMKRKIMMNLTDFVIVTQKTIDNMIRFVAFDGFIREDEFDTEVLRLYEQNNPQVYKESKTSIGLIKDYQTPVIIYKENEVITEEDFNLLITILKNAKVRLENIIKQVQVSYDNEYTIKTII